MRGSIPASKKPCGRGPSTLLILLSRDADDTVRAGVRAALQQLGVTVEEIGLPDREALAVVGECGLPGESLSRIPGVDRVVPLGDPKAPLVHATWSEQGLVVDLEGAKFGGGHVGVIAGPCTVESREDLLATAKLVHAAGAVALRGGVFKVRTSPHSYQGGGLEALDLLEEAAGAVGLPFFTELNDPRQVSEVGDRLQGVQIGARHMQNFPLLTEVAALGKPVLLKRHMAADVDEWLLAAEYLLSSGNDQVILCERGVNSPGRHVRYLLDIGVIPYLKARIGLPIVVDPSHAAGHHGLVPDLARAALAAGADGLIVEVHPRPEATRCDALQALPPDRFQELLAEFAEVAALQGRTLGGLERIERGAAGGAGRPSGRGAGGPRGIVRTDDLSNRSVGA